MSAPNACKPEILAVSTLKLASGQIVDVVNWSNETAALYIRGNFGASIVLPLVEQDMETLCAEMARNLTDARKKRKAAMVDQIIKTGGV